MVPRNSLGVPGTDTEAQPPRNFLEVPGSGSSTPQNTLNQQIDQQGDVQVSTSEPQANEDNEDQPLHQPLDHHILVYIKSYNGIIPLTISLGA
jgi:hypothetical protein